MKILLISLALLSLLSLSTTQNQLLIEPDNLPMPNTHSHNDSTDVTPPVSGPLDSYTWENRLIVLFTPSTGFPAYQTQLDSLNRRTAGLKDRDLQILHATIDGEITVSSHQQSLHRRFNDTQAAELYEKYEIGSESFILFLIGKDGTVKMRRAQPVAPQEIFDRIDRMPMRRREMQNQ